MQPIRSLTVSLAVLLASLDLISSAQVARLYPVDEAGRDSALLALRIDLLRALEDSDTAFVLSIVSPDVGNGFGGASGLEEFRRLWFVGGERNRKLDRLREALTLGGILVDDSSYVVPYYFVQFPDTLDVHSHALVLGKNVRVRKEPSLESEIRAQLSYEIVPLPKRWTGHADQSGNTDLVWLQVSLGDGTRGYVAEQYLRSAIGLRVTFRKRKGRWLLRGWARGD